MGIEVKFTIYSDIYTILLIYHIQYYTTQYTNLELLESLNAFLLLKSSMYAAGREVAVFE